MFSTRFGCKHLFASSPVLIAGVSVSMPLLHGFVLALFLEP
jgi:hypothetical protein